MAMDYNKVSQEIIDGVGGKENIASATHCMTRLRLVLHDDSKANDDKVKGIKGVKSVIKQGGQYQVVIGNEVSNLFKVFSTYGNFSEDAAPAEDDKPKGNPIQRLFGFIAGCMTPLLPAMLGTGMVKVLLTILTTTGVMTTTMPTYVILYGMADSFFYFLPIFLAGQIAKKTHHSEPMFMIVGAMLCYPNIVSLMAGTYEGVKLGTFLGMPATSFLHIPVITATYTSSVLPILLMTPVMMWAEDFADRVSPNMLKAFLKPMLFFLICTPVCFIVLGPLGNVIGNGLAAVFSAMYNAVPWLTVGVLSAIMPFIILTGMHYALIPLSTNNLALLGYDVIVLVTMFCSNVAQGGAALGVAVKAKDTDTKSEGVASGISAIVAGVTEPAMYGINLKYGTPMLAACIASGVSGLFCGITKVVGYTMGGSPSVFSLITFIGGDHPYRGVIFGAIGFVISVGLSFILTLILFKGDKAEAAETTSNETASEDAQDEKSEVKPLVTKIEIAAPMDGEAIELSRVEDEAFSSGALGEGAAIVPSDGHIYAPADGTVTTVMDTKHAIALTTDGGAELLIHVGMDTVSLNGAPFDMKVKENQKVKKGDLLLIADLDAIKKAGLSTVTPVLVTNSDDFVSVKSNKLGNIKHGELLYTVV